MEDYFVQQVVAGLNPFINQVFSKRNNEKENKHRMHLMSQSLHKSGLFQAIITRPLMSLSKNLSQSLHKSGLFQDFAQRVSYVYRHMRSQSLHKSGLFQAGSFWPDLTSVAACLNPFINQVFSKPKWKKKALTRKTRLNPFINQVFSKLSWTCVMWLYLMMSQSLHKSGLFQAGLIEDPGPCEHGSQSLHKSGLFQVYKMRFRPAAKPTTSQSLHKSGLFQD